MLEAFFRVLGSELKMQMVVYGIGSIESYEPPRLQLSLAILLKRKFCWIGDIEVFDPILSATESRVLEALDGSVLSVNEQERLNNIVLFGNNFGTCEQHVSEFRSSTLVDSSRHILAVRKFTCEFAIK
ncbi:Protein sensitivity to red light reduced 1 [Vitis vinifera]|uniref:Protein sensitivity to red light reduced 1 n=1 Tax=Vitis vinifera TaxID=29760 RepID=A0A438CU31_VITVI|nr:Protein sensitivity to red light reduced 1 [Vitis vinifera]